MAVSFNLEGQAYSFPDWITESTGQDMLRTLEKMLAAADPKAAEDTKKSVEKMVDLQKEGNKEAETTAEEQKKRDEELIKASREAGKNFKETRQALEQYKLDKQFDASFVGSLSNAFESEGEKVGKAMFTFGGMLIQTAGYVGGLLTGYAAYVGNAILGAGDSLNDLAAQGVGFNQTFQGFADSAGMGVSALSGLTGGFEASAKLIGQYSNVVAVGGIGQFAGAMRFAADTSEELGMSMEDSMEQFGDALSRRQSLLNVGNVSQTRLNQQVQKTVKGQMAYATALGISTEELQAFVESLVRDNGLLTASLLQFSDTVRSDVVAGIEIFASGLAATGGKAGQDIAAAFLEAGSAGAIGLSDAATGFVTALPSLAGPINEFSAAMRSGTLTQEQSQDMVTNLTKSLGNLDAGEKQRIFAMARLGDESAKTMAQAISQFEQSEEKIDEINKMFGTAFDMDTVQTGTNQFNKIMTQVSGGVSNAFYSLFANPEVMAVIEEGVQEIFAIFGMGVDDLSGAAMNSADMVKGMIPTIKSFVSTVVDVAKDIAGFFAQFKTDEGFDFGAMFSALADKAIGLLFKGIYEFVKIWLALTVAKHYATTILLPALKNFSGQMFEGAKGFAVNMFQKYGPVAKGLATNALNYAKGMFASGATAGKNILNNAIQYARTTFPMNGAKSLASQIGGYASAFGQAIFSKGKDVASKVASMASGFMSNIMKGGAPDAVGNMASKAGGLMGGLKQKAGGMLGTLKEKAGGIGSKVSGALSGESKAADKVTMPMGKSGGFLKSIANAVKKFGDNKVIKGAAALTLLGGAVMVAGIGLKKFTEVDVAAIIKGTVALGGLALLANALGKGSTAMIKGAAAVAILGAAVVPLAFGLNIMKDVGLETIVVLAGSLLTLGVAAAVMGSFLPVLLPGAIAIAALGASMIPLAFALNLMKDVGIETVGVLAGSLLVLGVAAAAMGFALPFILMGAVAISALGFAMIPFAFAAKMFGEGMGPLSEGLDLIGKLPMMDIIGSLLGLGATMTMLILAIPGMILSGIALAALGTALAPLGIFGKMANEGLTGLAEKLKDIAMIPFANLFMAAPALLSLAAGMMALSAGGLVSGLLDGLGKLFGSDSPFDKLAKIGNNAEHIVKMAEEMRGMGSTLDAFEDSLSSLNADAIAGKFYTIAMAINAMRSSIENLSAGSMAKLMLLKAIGVTPGAAQPAEAGGGTRVTPPTPQTPQQDGFDLAMRRIGSTPISADTVPTTNMVGPEIPAQANQTQPAQPGMMDQFKDGVKQVGEETMDAKDVLLAEIRDLQRENNRLLKKETKAISELDI